jgi:hypothetical protein
MVGSALLYHSQMVLGQWRLIRSQAARLGDKFPDSMIIANLIQGHHMMDNSAQYWNVIPEFAWLEWFSLMQLFWSISWLIPWKYGSFPTNHVIQWLLPQQWKIALYQGLFVILLAFQCQKKYLAHRAAVEHNVIFCTLEQFL